MLLTSRRLKPASAAKFRYDEDMMCQRPFRRGAPGRAGNATGRKPQVHSSVIKMAGKSPSLRRIQADIREPMHRPIGSLCASPLEDDMFEW